MDSAHAQLENQVKDIRARTSASKFNDPEENPEDVLRDLNAAKTRLYELEKHLSELNRCRQILVGTSSGAPGAPGYDLELVNKTRLYLELKFDIWRHKDNIQRTIDDWKSTQFKKVWSFL